jgi:hypothetical protein
MTTPIIFEDCKQWIVDGMTANKYPKLFVGYRFVDGVLYRQYLLIDGKKILVEGK